MQIQQIPIIPIDNSEIGLTDIRLGLSVKTVLDRQKKFGMNMMPSEVKTTWWKEIFLHFKSPLVILLLFASIISFILSDVLNATIILIMILLSVLIDYFREKRASDLADSLRKIVNTKVISIREGKEVEIPHEEIVPGDILRLENGRIVPADSKVLFTSGLFVDQSSLTGESFPVLKTTLSDDQPPENIFDSADKVFMGCSVVGGSATVMVLTTGMKTEFGRIFKKSVQREEVTDFAKGMNHFGVLILKISLFLMLFIFFVNALLDRQILESFVFAIAVAVGLTPELLPMIMTLTMTRGAASMVKKGVIVKHLPAIPNLGTMEILCTDKTGTLTEDKTILIKSVDKYGKEAEQVFKLAYINSFFQGDLKNPMDNAILEHDKAAVSTLSKLYEIPYDFYRKRVSIIYQEDGVIKLVCKGAPEEIFKISLQSQEEMALAIKQYEVLSNEGFRTLAIAEKVIPQGEILGKELESNLQFIGFVAFVDPVKQDADDVVRELTKIGVEIKIITGDNRLVTENICRKIGLEIKGVLEGFELAALTDDALKKRVENATIFTRFTPIQKTRVIQILKLNHHSIGYMGDGINDAPSLKAADIGISVYTACDVAKDAADLILTKKDLLVLKDGILEGRKTFVNSMKYVLMCISSNFGNMFSVAAATIFLPFFPMIPIQILINNFLYDTAQINLPSDHVDEASIVKPQNWDIRLIRRYMVVFGLSSSIFDLLTFWILRNHFSLTTEQFRTGWFMESLATQILVVFVVRTPVVPFFRSKPSKKLLIGALSCLAAGWLLPYLPFAHYLGFQLLPVSVLLYLVAIIVLYLLSAEGLKKIIQHWSLNNNFFDLFRMKLSYQKSRMPVKTLNQ